MFWLKLSIFLTPAPTSLLPLNFGVTIETLLPKPPRPAPVRPPKRAPLPP
jgi:hypothetical protein